MEVPYVHDQREKDGTTGGKLIMIGVDSKAWPAEPGYKLCAMLASKARVKRRAAAAEGKK